MPRFFFRHIDVAAADLRQRFADAGTLLPYAPADTC